MTSLTGTEAACKLHWGITGANRTKPATLFADFCDTMKIRKYKIEGEVTSVTTHGTDIFKKITTLTVMGKLLNPLFTALMLPTLSAEGHESQYGILLL